MLLSKAISIALEVFFQFMHPLATKPLLFLACMCVHVMCVCVSLCSKL